jgi:hypothetical protein
MMPTGYTSDLYGGKEQDFRSFALSCARAFGALITMRDDPVDTPIPERFEPSTYSDRELSRAQDRLIELSDLTEAEADREAATAFHDVLAAWEEGEEERKARCERCGHFGCQHRLDDSLNIPPTDPSAPFRCLGPKLNGCDDRCPDMVRPSNGEQVT